MFKVLQKINNIKKEQHLLEDRLNKKTTEFNKEWDKWGKKQTQIEKKLP